jgi:hypothetical protein
LLALSQQRKSNCKTLRIRLDFTSQLGTTLGTSQLGTTSWAKLEQEREKERQEREKERREMNKKWGELANKMGTLVEDIVAPNISNVWQENSSAC